jgi:hypothetical protein
MIGWSSCIPTTFLLVAKRAKSCQGARFIPVMFGFDAFPLPNQEHRAQR